jgi:hypothetical protein
MGSAGRLAVRNALSNARNSASGSRPGAAFFGFLGEEAIAPILAHPENDASRGVRRQKEEPAFGGLFSA